jgi:hypothetical protein
VALLAILIGPTALATPSAEAHFLESPPPTCSSQYLYGSQQNSNDTPEQGDYHLIAWSNPSSSCDESKTIASATIREDTNETANAEVTDERRNGEDYYSRYELFVERHQCPGNQSIECGSSYQNTQSNQTTTRHNGTAVELSGAGSASRVDAMSCDRTDWQGDSYHTETSYVGNQNTQSSYSHSDFGNSTDCLTGARGHIAAPESGTPLAGSSLDYGAGYERGHVERCAGYNQAYSCSVDDSAALFADAHATAPGVGSNDLAERFEFEEPLV